MSPAGAEASLSGTLLLFRNTSFDFTKKLSDAIEMLAFAYLNGVHNVLHTFQCMEKSGQ